MKRNRLLFALLAGVALITAGVIYASDHIDAPNVKNKTTDITDLYAFQSTDNANNLVFVLNTQGLLSPAATATAKFDENTLIQLNIDNTGDAVEDLVIQCKYNASTKKMEVYGPIKPSATGLRSKIEGHMTASVDVTPYNASTPISATGSTGVKVFAGPRDDPFFFDLNQYHKILAGTASGFANPGSDAFAGTNVMSVVLEVPKALLNAPSSGNLNVWLTTRSKE